MATERKLRKVWFLPCVWEDNALRTASPARTRYFNGYAKVPKWLMERIAVLRLLEEKEESPLGSWSIDRWSDSDEDHDYLIARQPGDPPWGEW